MSFFIATENQYKQMFSKLVLKLRLKTGALK